MLMPQIFPDPQPLTRTKAVRRQAASAAWVVVVYSLVSVAVVVLLLSSPTAAAASTSSSDVACGEQLSKLQHRWDRKQSRWTAETEKLQDELGLCLATKMACETRETMCKQQLGTFDDADIVSPAETIQELESRLQECQQTLDLKVAAVTKLERQNSALESKVGSLETKLSLEQEAAQHAAATLQEELRVIRMENDSCQSAWQSRTVKIAALQQEADDLRRQLEEDQELSRQRARELTEQHQEELEAVQAKAHLSVSRMQEEMAAMRQHHAQETIRIRNESATQMQDRMEERAAKWQADRQALHRTIRELRAKNTATQRLLQTVKDDLFVVRRELFDLQETFVRGPDLQRRLRQQRWQSWKQWVLKHWRRLVRLLDESLVHPVQRTWARVLAAYQQYVEPVWRSVQAVLEPVWQSIREATLTAWKFCSAFYQKWYPVVRRHVVANWRYLSKHAQSTGRAVRQRTTLWWTQISDYAVSTSTRVFLYAKSTLYQASLRFIGAWRQRASWSEISESTALVGRDVYFVAKGLRRELALVSRGLRIELGQWLYSNYVRAWNSANRILQFVAQNYRQQMKPLLQTFLQRIKLLSGTAADQFQQRMQSFFQTLSDTYQHHVQPHIKSLLGELSQLYQHRVKPLFPALVEEYRHSVIFVARLYHQHAEPHLTAMVEGYHRSQVATANALSSVTDLALEYSRIRRYPAQLTRSLEWVNLHTMELVYCGEWLLLLTIAIILLRPRRRRRRRKNVVLSKAFPSSKKKKSKKIQPDNVSSR